MSTTIFNITPAESSIEWIGKKVTGAHNGTIGIASGSLTLTDGKLTGGKFTIDTTSIRILDLTDPATNQQFAGHLASEDFFGIEKYPTASLDITSISPGAGNSYYVAGNLTIKGITHEIEFDAYIDSLQAGKLRASATLIVDRTNYEMKFRSGNFFKDLGDNLIYNDFTLNIQLTATAA